MIVSKEQYLHEPFVLTATDLQRLAEVFQQSIGQPSFEMVCHDGVNRRFDDLGGLLSFENGWSKRVRSLWIQSTDDARSRRARLRFSAEHTPVFLDVSAEAQVVAVIDDAIRRQLETMQPSYVRRRLCDTALALLAGFAAAVAAFYVMAALRAFGQFPAGPGPGVATMLLGGELAGVGLAMAAAWQAHRPKGPLFPTTAFALAKGRARQRGLTGLRWALFITTAGILLATILLNLAA